MTIMGLRCATLALLLAGSGSFARAEAQESQDVHTRNDCRLAAQVIRTGQPAPHMEWAYGAIQRCDETGPNVLAERWRTVTDSAEVGRLAWATWRSPARRLVFEAIAEIVATRSASIEARLRGIALLAGYAEPNVRLRLDDLRRPGGRPTPAYSVSHSLDDPGELSDVADEVISLMERLRDTSADETIARIAGEYARFLRGLNSRP